MAVAERRRGLRLCGQCALDGAAVEATGRLLVLMVILGLRGRQGMARDDLFEVLWPDQAPKAGRAALDPLLSRLRKIAGPVSGRGAIRLDQPKFRVDVHLALRSLEQARGDRDPAARLLAAATAARVLGGELAPACRHPWVDAERESLRERHLEALEIVATNGLLPGASGFEQSLAAGRELAQRRPHREQATAVLMDLFEKAGDRSAAVTAYERLRRRLDDDLGLIPGAEIRERHARLVRGDAPRSFITPPLPHALAELAEVPVHGRERELAVARDATAARRLLLISGPPGIGKTHLAARLARAAHARGANVMLARGIDVRGGPFDALVGALRPVVAHNDAGVLRGRLGDLGDELIGLFPGLGGAVGSGRSSRLEADAERHRVLEAVGALLEAGGADAGSMLVIDDVQSLDPSSLTMLARMLVTGAVPDLQLVVTARPASRYAELLLEAAGSESAVSLTLEPLSLPAITEMVREVHAAWPVTTIDELARELAASTGGWPLLVRAALTAGGHPERLGDAIAPLLRWAGDDARRLLEIAALDEDAGVDVLSDATGLPLEDVVLALDRARRSGLLSTNTDVVHRSIRDALTVDLGATQRAALHRRLACAHEANESPAATIAAHWGKGQTTDARRQAAEWEQLAAEQALRLFAAEDAISHAQRAIDHLAGSQPVRQAELMALCARAHHMVSQLGEGFAAAREAQRQARALDRRDLVAQIAADAAGHRLATAVTEPEVVALVEEGLAAATAEQGGVRARLLARLAGLLLTGPVARRDRLVAEALQLARADGDPGTLSEVLLHAHTSTVHTGRPHERARLVDEATAMAKAAGRPELALHARMQRTSDRLEAMEFDHARAELAQWQLEADAARLPYNRWAVRQARPSFSILDGCPGRAEEELREADRLGALLGDDQGVTAASASQWLSLGLATGRGEEVGEGIAAYVRTGVATPGWSAASAYAAAMAGRRDEALEHLASMLAAGLDSIVDPNRCAALSFAADAAVIVAAPAGMTAVLRAALDQRAGTLVVQHYCGAPHGLVDSRRARLAALLGDTRSAGELLGLARRSAGPSPPVLVDLDLRFADSVVGCLAGDRDRAASVADELIADARDRGMFGIARNVEGFRLSHENFG